MTMMMLTYLCAYGMVNYFDGGVVLRRSSLTLRSDHRLPFAHHHRCRESRLLAEVPAEEEEEREEMRDSSRMIDF